MAYGYGTPEVHKVDWTFVLVNLVGAIFGGLLGFFLSFFGLILGIILLVATMFIKGLKGNVKAFVMAFSVAMIAGGLASFIAGGSQALSSETLSQSGNIWGQMFAIPQSINEKVFETLKLKPLELTPEMIPQSVSESIVASALATTTPPTPTAGTWAYSSY